MSPLRSIPPALLLPGQTPTPHPQSDHPKAAMYKVLKDILEEKGEGTSIKTSARVGGRVRSKAGKEAISKQLQNGLEKLDNAGLVDLKTGEIKSKKKKQPKEKTPEQLALKEAKGYCTKYLDFIGAGGYVMLNLH